MDNGEKKKKGNEEKLTVLPSSQGKDKSQCRRIYFCLLSKKEMLNTAICTAIPELDEVTLTSSRNR